MERNQGIWVTIQGNRWDYRELSRVLLMFYRWTVDILGARHDPRYLQDMMDRADLVETYDDITGTMLPPDNNMQKYRSVDFRAGLVQIDFDPQPALWGYVDEQGRPMQIDSPDLNHGLPLLSIDNRPQITISPGSHENVSWLVMTLGRATELKWMATRVETSGYDENEHQAIIEPSPALLLSHGPIKARLVSQATVAFWRLRVKDWMGSRDTS
jgi:hypothetical protein